MNPRGNASTVITVDAACSKLYITELQLWVSNIPRGLASKIKAQRLFPSDKFKGVFSGSRQVNALRVVC